MCTNPNLIFHYLQYLDPHAPSATCPWGFGFFPKLSRGRVGCPQQKKDYNILDSDTRILVTGGASSNKSILQVISDIFNAPVYTLVRIKKFHLEESIFHFKGPLFLSAMYKLCRFGGCFQGQTCLPRGRR